ncbi:related to C2H2 transcription factor (AmdA) [Phialocephala subalpina]|uniref:Related to C2H2 transcription factor (AmdA) n=1 Tax=Phialocephala subalpina TaxID=576137 RepID=A0A1L7WN75_9HELO|nr:related to C2H2 transcription factor (AmdA) [Phialocephala subalpina]
MLDAAETTTQEAAPATSKKPKRFLCKHCQRRFARLEHLQRHERIHTQEKPFGCRLCGHHFTRSDLLIRHERLTHNRETSSVAQRNERDEDEDGASQSRPNKRRAATAPYGTDGNHGTTGLTPQSMRHTSSSTNPTFTSPMIANQSDEYSLAALSMAAEYSSLHSSFLTPPAPDHNTSSYQSLPTQNDQIEMLSDPLALQNTGHMQGLGLEESLDSLAAFLDNEPLSSYHFSSLTSAEQLPFFSPESFNYANDFLPHHDTQLVPGSKQNHQHVEESNSFSRFGSRLPSLQPEEPRSRPEHQATQSRPFYEVSSDDRQNISSKLEEFTSVLPEDFQLPTRLALCRYIAAYVNGFHEHLPLIHLPTMTIEGCAIELILGMAAVGAQYCFEGEKGVELFNASQAIAVQRIRRRDARLINIQRRAESEVSTLSRGLDDSSNVDTPSLDPSNSGPLGLPSETETSATSEREDLIQTAQALLILMAMATWAKHKEILREALAIQSILATLIRDDGLKSHPVPDDATWEEWVRIEITKRTKLIVFCFFNLHCIVYNIPPLILNSEVKLALPSSAAEFKAQSAAAWQEARQSGPEILEFQEALRRLFSRSGKDKTGWNSSLGNYVLIHALIQHIFFVRQIAKCRYDGPDLKSEEVSSLEHALRNWQIGWKRNPESSLDPTDPNGPVAFNSTALLRLAYIRLNVDTGPGRALDTRDPVQIANAFRESPAIKRTPKLVRAVLHSAHALSVPVKIGVRLVAKTQTFIWSIQHSLCSLECAFLLSKWLEALSQSDPDPPITDDERRITSLVKTMLDETEFAVPADMPLDSPATRKWLSAGVLRVWATIFKGAQTWAIVDVIGSSLNIYADMLEPN